MRTIPIAEIEYLKANDECIKINIADKAYMKKAISTNYEKRLPSSNFTRIHRSYLVNLSEVIRIEPLEKSSHLAILKSRGKLPVSKSGYQLFKSTPEI